MKKLILALVISIALTGCMPTIFQPQPTNPAPTFTLPPISPATETPPPPLPSETATALPLPTDTPIPTATASGEATLLPTFTPTAAITATLPVGTPTPTLTLFPRLYGTLPPWVAWGHVTLKNRARAEAYISLQCTASNGQLSIQEYPVPRHGELSLHVPAGDCHYVAWVGGREMAGFFHLGKEQDLAITLYRDKIALH